MTNTGYLTSFAVSYQLEGVTAEEAAHIADTVQRTLATNLPDLIGYLANAQVDGTDRKVLAVRVEAQQRRPEEYDIR